MNAATRTTDHRLRHRQPFAVQPALAELGSGPPGTMVGRCEIAVDAICERRIGDAVVRPKLVASTATVRRAERQIQALFGRTAVDIFPPPGPDRRDSFFARTIREPDQARLHVGVASQGARSRSRTSWPPPRSVLLADFSFDPQRKEPGIRHVSMVRLGKPSTSRRSRPTRTRFVRRGGVADDTTSGCASTWPDELRRCAADEREQAP